jgi:hypothetical protein
MGAAFNDLESLSELFATRPLCDSPAAVAEPVVSITHKRQVSEAIPRDERPNVSNDAPNEAPGVPP